MRIFIDGIDAAGVKRTGPPDDAVNLVAFSQEKFCEIGSVLPANAGDERLFHFVSLV